MEPADCPHFSPNCIMVKKPFWLHFSTWNRTSDINGLMSDHQTAFFRDFKVGRKKRKKSESISPAGVKAGVQTCPWQLSSSSLPMIIVIPLFYGMGFVLSLSLTCAGPQTLFFFFALQKENRTELMFPCIINNYMVGLSFPAVLCLNRLFCGASKLESLTTELKGFDYCFISPFSSLCLHLTAINYIKLWWRTRKKEKRW